MLDVDRYWVPLRRFTKQAVKGGLALSRVPTSSIRLMPDFIIIGGQKCGTTSLYNYLIKHPCVAPALYKEVRFFDINFRKGVAWYQAHFPSSLYRYYIKKTHGWDIVVGEASPYYIFHPHAPKRVLQVVPDAKLIALLRNPIDRAYSHYQHKVRARVETLSFEEAIDREQERLCRETDRLLKDESYFSFNHYNYAYLSRGVYADQLEEWMCLFPREQMLILRSEDFYDDPSLVFRRVLEFLDLPSWELREYKRHLHSRYPSLDIVTRRRLAEHYEPHNQRLYELLGSDLGWQE